jgi:ABC-2 type transport system ATP-binding protein
MKDIPGPAPTDAAIQVTHLRKCYGDLVAVDDVSFSVAEGEIFGILGPNGAGKTTTVECVTGLRRPDAGQVRVLGLDPQVDRAELHEMVGVQLQDSLLPGLLRVREILRLYQSFYRDPADADEFLQILGLADKADALYKSLSGGQKQRLSIALALIGRPKVAVLDEMTTGLDPAGRRGIWDFIEGVRDRGTTLVLVTHFMDEAQRLCDRLAVVVDGRIAATGTPSQLTEQAGGGKRVRFVPSQPFSDDLLTSLPEVTGLERHGSHVVVSGTGQLVSVVIAALAAAGISADDVGMESASLEDAFLQLTGSHPHDADANAEEAAPKQQRRLVRR